VIDRLASLPPGGGRAWYFPGAADHGQADIVARVARRDGSSWIACLTRPEPGLGHDGIFALPCGQRVFIAGGVADRDNPESWTALALRSPRVAWSPDHTVAVLSDGTSVHAFGTHGPLWSATLGSDASVTDVSDDTLVCDVYDWPTGTPVTQRFDLQTGRPR
jgi:hypothetical protein